MAPTPTKSKIWKHFLRFSAEKAKCLLCSELKDCKGGSTSAMWRHLKTLHKVEANEIESEMGQEEQLQQPTKKSKPAASASNSQRSMMDFVQRKSMKERLAKLCALDGIAPFTISRSEFFREAFIALGFELPKSPNTIMEMVHSFYKEARETTIREIKASGTKYSLTMDEWTSIANRRYLNVNINAHGGASFNLGLIRIPKSCPAEEVKRLMGEKLLEFGLNQKDVVAATVDGAAVMTKFGRLVAMLHQQCYNHGIHLAVIDVLVKNKKTTGDDNTSDAESVAEDEVVENEGEGNEMNDETVCFNINETETMPDSEIELRPDVQAALSRVRAIIRVFRKSPVKNAVLQKYIKEKLNKELQLQLDCSTRWNSIAVMLERFLAVYECTKEALYELNHNHLLVDDILPMLEELSRALQPIQMAVESLSKRNTNLLEAEGK